MAKELPNVPQDEGYKGQSGIPNEEDRLDLRRFPHTAIEQKWMHRWVDDQLYKAHDDSEKPRYFVLDMYPYPSGAGLHVGHVEGYTATDIVSRYKRMNGFEVLHPMGWDAFGLPTENYAIKTGKDPHQVTADNADVFRGQCIRTGFSIDWGREIDTSSPEYYKWTQFIFLKLFEQGLAYKAESPVNWCTGCQTVIANEQVIESHCERCDSEVESRKIEQWFFRITDYADRLIEDLEGLDWPESTKERQRDWIGRTEGVEISVELANTDERLTVFTTEPESLEGAERIVLAPEHPSISTIVTGGHREEVDSYILSIPPQQELQRKKQKKKTSVFMGNYAINPLTGKRLEVWVADYVFMDEYGGVRVEQAANTKGTGTVYPDRETVLQQLGELATPVVRYKLRDWIISRERYWGAPIPIIHCGECGDQRIGRCLVLHRLATCQGQHVDSAWYYLRFADPHNIDSLGDRELVNKWLPVNYYMGGADHATGHLLYARFITKVLHDLGYLDFDEPFTKLIHQGMILGEDGRKMSKRWQNVVNPLDVSDEYGSDALRIYEMFLGPLEQSKVWDTKAITGARRFVDRVWRLQGIVQEGESRPEEVQAINILIENVTNAVETNRLNIAVSEFMKFLNTVERSGRLGRQSYETLLILLAPLAPFITEELWERLGNKYSIHQQMWPSLVPQERPADSITLSIMINNKFIGTIIQEEGSELIDEEIYALLLEDPKFQGKLDQVTVKKIVHRRGKVFNILI
ncbi:MAG: Leucine-tRNA ligase [Candidatus Gottesmanbacteria bacterium GW2011_GWA2_47_9]|uniref:leucine--tRNA ligase n=1 Tax=Candidatus Gottesmanbacteria bacterium GW2011_GWA2_47_9 TaxID=1618445 RepID=A0A0G1X1R8_9BACT|nr:MAG: Leucine-tRNA ligase [Candidatus Gottesmanbacteria bacterium GW2011_GWA2_47_9]